MSEQLAQSRYVVVRRPGVESHHLDRKYGVVSIKLQLDVCDRNQWRRHLVNAF